MLEVLWISTQSLKNQKLRIAKAESIEEQVVFVFRWLFVVEFAYPDKNIQKFGIFVIFLLLLTNCDELRLKIQQQESSFLAIKYSLAIRGFNIRITWQNISNMRDFCTIRTSYVFLQFKGPHTFPFSIVLPQNIPSSFQGT